MGACAMPVIRFIFISYFIIYRVLSSMSVLNGKTDLWGITRNEMFPFASVTQRRSNATTIFSGFISSQSESTEYSILQLMISKDDEMHDDVQREEGEMERERAERWSCAYYSLPFDAISTSTQRDRNKPTTTATKWNEIITFYIQLRFWWCDLWTGHKQIMNENTRSKQNMRRPRRNVCVDRVGGAPRQQALTTDRLRRNNNENNIYLNQNQKWRAKCVRWQKRDDRELHIATA